MSAARGFSSTNSAATVPASQVTKAPVSAWNRASARPPLVESIRREPNGDIGSRPRRSIPQRSAFAGRSRQGAESPAAVLYEPSRPDSGVQRPRMTPAIFGNPRAVPGWGPELATRRQRNRDYDIQTSARRAEGVVRFRFEGLLRARAANRVERCEI